MVMPINVTIKIDFLFRNIPIQYCSCSYLPPQYSTGSSSGSIKLNPEWTLWHVWLHFGIQVTYCA